MSRSIAFQMDHLDQLNHKFDTTLALAQSAAQRGYDLFHYEVGKLRLDIKNGATKITATGNPLLLDKETGIWNLGKSELRDLSTFDAILMRQDPPFDLSYITATHILELLRDKVKIINDPVGVRNAPEKLLVTHFPHLMPPTLITRDIEAIKQFRDEHKDIILKPLHGYAGHGIFHLSPHDDNLAALVEMLAAQNREPWMIQKFLQVSQYGDKRIVLIDGEIVGHFTRFPASGDMRGNLRVGARAEKSELTKRDLEICEALKPALIERGLFFTGLDIIGNYVTEINVTSPTGLVLSDQFAGYTGKDSIAEKFWQKIFG